MVIRDQRLTARPGEAERELAAGDSSWLAYSPLVEASFRTDEELERAWALIPAGQPVSGLPDRGIIVDIATLERIQSAGIPVYPSGVPLADRFNQPIDVDELLDDMRSIQRSYVFGG